MTKYVKVSDFFYHVINYSLFTSEPEIDLIFLLNLVNFNLPRDFFRQNSELGKSRGKAPKAVTRVCLGLLWWEYSTLSKSRQFASDRQKILIRPVHDTFSNFKNNIGTEKIVLVVSIYVHHRKLTRNFIQVWILAAIDDWGLSLILDH